MKRDRQDRKHPSADDPLAPFHPAVRAWFHSSFQAPTLAQIQGWPLIARGDSTLIVAPTGTGKTLAAFLWCIHRLMFDPLPGRLERCRIVYVSPLKALAADVERNLRAPLDGIAAAARGGNFRFSSPAVAVRSGDTPARERAIFLREPADILITTPESLYLLLTSRARERLRSVDTVIVDEIHALVPSKRGAHLALSLERLQDLRDGLLQRIGLSATQRPLEEVAHFLGGTEPPNRGAQAEKPDGETQHDTARMLENEFAASGRVPPSFRPVTIVNTGEKKALHLQVEVPVEDLARISQTEAPSDETGFKRTSIWSAIHPRLLDLVRNARSSIIFVNSRRIAERIAGALNELAGENIVRAHHGSLAASQRREIEELLKTGQVRGLVATSSLELGIDMEAVDQVIQVECPPSVASGMQRIGRAGHRANVVSSGIIFPKYRADLVACAALARNMHASRVEAIRYPRNPLDVLAQQIAAIVSIEPEPMPVARLFRLIRGAAPYAGFSRSMFQNLLDMLSGRYPSDEFADLRPRITWDRISNTLTPRQGTRTVAVVNAGTIPDRGTYGVFLAGAEPGAARVGELDEEMVFESHVGDTFVLGATSWRVEEILHDRVLVSPAPGEPGTMPFWHGDQPGRPIEFGREIGAMIRELRSVPRNTAIARLMREHDLTTTAAENLLRYLDDQYAATSAVPDDRTILIESVHDELGDWRVCVLSPLGIRVHAPWALAISGKIRRDRGIKPDTMWTDDGFVVRFPETDQPPPAGMLLLKPGEAEQLLIEQLGSTPLFAGRFREIASRALLLPKRRPGARTPLWQRRKRAADLLSLASRFASFPMLLETYRECLHDTFDMPGLAETLRNIDIGAVQVIARETQKPSPFASAVLFSYVASYIYEGDAPLAERRAQALSIDPAQLQELLGDTDFRELLDPAVLDETEMQLQFLSDGRKAAGMDGLHDLLLRLGDLSPAEISARSKTGDAGDALQVLLKAGRILKIEVGGKARYIAIEEAGKYGNALGTKMPKGVPAAFLETTETPLQDLLRRYARTHIPFTAREISERYAMPREQAESLLEALSKKRHLIAGQFRPDGNYYEWCDPDVLRILRNRTLARLRKQIEPVEPTTFVRLITHWSGILVPRKGSDALLDAVESLQGAPLPASILETEILPARMREFEPSELDTLSAAGEIVWTGVGPLGQHDGRIALYLADRLQTLWRPPLLGDVPEDPDALASREKRILTFLQSHGASFFAPLHAAAGGGFPGETLEALWKLVWKGVVTNDSFHPLRAFTRTFDGQSGRRKTATGIPGSSRENDLGSRRTAPPSGEGRWSLVASRIAKSPSHMEWTAAMAQLLLNRYGVLVRSAVAAESLPGGFGTIYPALKQMEAAGRVRRGYFVRGSGPAQFAAPAAVDLLRTLREAPETPEMAHLAASDPANPYGSILGWPEPTAATDQPQGGAGLPLSRAVGARVILINGTLAAYLRGRNPGISVFLPEDEPERSQFGHALAAELRVYSLRSGRHRGLLISEINGLAAAEHQFSAYLRGADFVESSSGFSVRRPKS